MARKPSMIDKARKVYEDALAGIHIDIGSHNTNPRSKRKAVVRPKRTTPIKRSTRRTNPTQSVDVHALLRKEWSDTAAVARGPKTTEHSKLLQAHVSHAQGVADTLKKLKLLTSTQHAQYLRDLKGAALGGIDIDKKRY